MSEAHPPLTPAECDVSDQGWFQLHHRRLRNSDWWTSASDLARSRSVDLWCAAWEAVPAGSLRDDDHTLARLAGFGRDLKAWRAVREEILKPWVRCADGRLYHPTLCEIANEAWARKLKYQQDKAEDAERKRLARAAKSEKRPPDNAPRPADTARTSENVRSNKGEERKGDSSLRSEEAPTLPMNGADPVQAAFDEYNIVAANAGWKIAKVLNPERRRLIKARLKSSNGLRGWDAQLKRAAAQQWLLGRPGGSWRCDLDYFASDKGWTKILEDTGENPNARPHTQTAGRSNAADRNRAAADAQLASLRRVAGEGGDAFMGGPDEQGGMANGPDGRHAALPPPKGGGDAQSGDENSGGGSENPAVELLPAD